MRSAVGLPSMVSFSVAVILALSRSATFCAISLWMANISFKSRSYCSAQTWVSVRVSINCAFRRRSGTAPADAAFQNVRHAKLIADLADISFAAIFHDTGPADDFQIGDLRQLGQNVVLHAIGKGLRFLSARSDFQTAERRFQLLADAGLVRFSKRFHPTAAANATRDAASSALVGLRRTHFLPRAKIPVCRA